MTEPARYLSFARAERAGTALALALLLALLLLAHLARPAAAEARRPPPFAAAETAHPGVRLFPKWAGLLERSAAERARDLARGFDRDRGPCRGADCAVRRWRGFLATLGGAPPLRQLEAVQAYLNRVPYRSDRDAHGVSDHWATPGEFLTKGGDCEDYAIAKLVSLRLLGWAAEDLRLVIVEDARAGGLHAVLVAFHGGTAHVLDNLARDVAPASAFAHYRAVYSLSETGWFHHADPPATPRAAARAATAAGDTAAIESR
jgi:predicted transglutaminase-like cysteine proteinase